jgi:phosphodiesterase/alkaline phosphatase D-like protein
LNGQTTSLTASLLLDKQIITSQAITVENRPKVIQFNDLEFNRDYMVVFHDDDDDDDITTGQSTVTFRTFSNETSGKVVVVSCDRYFEDEDVSMWSQLLRDEQDRLAMIHLGDNIYADVVGRKYLNAVQNGKPVDTFDQLMDGYRQVYRKTWGYKVAQQLLRHGAHYMIPDDHDIINNLDRRFIVDDNGNPSALADVMEAGRRVFLEYQYQLRDDLPSSDSYAEVYFFREFMNVCWMFLDLRMGRAFRNDTQAPLFGTYQMQDFQSHIDSCSSNEIVISTSIPILFTSTFAAKKIFEIEHDKYCNHPDFLPETTQFLDTLGKVIAEKKKSVTILSGDIHQFNSGKICNKDNCISQIVTSGITKESTVIHGGRMTKLFWTLNTHFQIAKAGAWRLIRSRNLWSSNIGYYFGKNYAVLQVHNATVPYVTVRGVKSEIETLEERFVGSLIESAPEILLVLLLATSVLCIAAFVFIAMFRTMITRVSNEAYSRFS